MERIGFFLLALLYAGGIIIVIVRVWVQGLLIAELKRNDRKHTSDIAELRQHADAAYGYVDQAVEQVLAGRPVQAAPLQAAQAELNVIHLHARRGQRRRHRVVR
jgi:DNA-binding GntR family transcriptional regulator